jgi:molybdenum-dependent DNA-binding transcriptional regulator ModE
MPQKLTPYHTNFIKAVKMVIADRKLETTKEAAEYIGINYMAMWKIMDGTNKPTADNCVKLLKKGKFNANWLFLNEGEMYYNDEANLHNIITELQAIKKRIR